MIVTFNGNEREVDQRTSVADVMGELSDRRRGVAVAVNGAVVPRSEWDGRLLQEGDRVEVLAAVGGG